MIVPVDNKTAPATTTEIGHAAEQAAEKFLIKNGLSLLERNFRHQSGEIDLIMQDNEGIVFVEVRLRKNQREAIESIDHKKCSRIIKTSLYYLQINQHFGERICRFDIVPISGRPPNWRIDWIKNAFQA